MSDDQFSAFMPMQSICGNTKGPPWLNNDRGREQQPTETGRFQECSGQVGSAKVATRTGRPVYAFKSLLRREGQAVEFVTSASRFEATQGLLWDGPRTSEPPSDEEDDTRAGTLYKLPFLNIKTTNVGN
ncbi:hypothetical protein AVEN_221023-1 [Araneus ventricosus]|uniref:Uncharacterized protein n=1 Tax=Araneus ventricosus TaxID=182803 RepID=A0A4Y2WXT1_ARAVE|nr:hypothetical protein AVEN_221023-1 [Araneus ventricosus]